MKVKVAVFDLEIQKAIPTNEGDLIPGIQYCAGWGDFPHMGISAASFVGMDSHQSECYVRGKQDDRFDRAIKAMLRDLREAGYLIGGFNSKKFDDILLQANGINFKSDFDVLEMTLQAAGVLTPYWEDGKSYSLKVLAKANGLEKTGHGANAPILWQQGRYDELREYCMNDSKITLDLYKKLLDGSLKDPNDGRLLHWQN